MKMFRWVVAFDVEKTWVADGFDLSDARAKDMLSNEVGGAYDWELGARVIAAPSPLKIARAQGYGPKHPHSGKEVRRLIDDAPHALKLDRAIVTAINLLDSVAFVSTEGDTTEPLALLHEVLNTIRGTP